MDHLPTPTTSEELFTAGDMTAETVISELNLFNHYTYMYTASNSTAVSTRGPSNEDTKTVTSLPQWDGGSCVNNGGPASSTVCKAELRPNDTGSEEPYDPLHSSGNEDSSSSLPLTPPTSDSLPCSSGNLDHLPNPEDIEQPPRKKRHPIPDEKKDAKYWERRRKNNVAAKRSREMRRKKTEEELKTAREAIQENQKLRQEVEVLKAEINSLRRLLKDANMTLSLWIRARQTSEPTAQLPPMLRGQNVSFVNFPVSSSV